MYLWTGNWRFKVMDRKEVERQAVAVRMTALDGGGAKSGPPGGVVNGGGGLAAAHDAGTVLDLENGALPGGPSDMASYPAAWSPPLLMKPYVPHCCRRAHAPFAAARFNP